MNMLKSTCKYICIAAVAAYFTAYAPAPATAKSVLPFPSGGGIIPGDDAQDPKPAKPKPPAADATGGGKVCEVKCMNQQGCVTEMVEIRPGVFVQGQTLCIENQPKETCDEFAKREACSRGCKSGKSFGPNQVGDDGQKGSGKSFTCP